MFTAFLDWLIRVFRTICRERFSTESATPSGDELTLTYFDIPGLAQSIRNTLAYGEVEYDDKRLTMEEFKERKKSFPFGQVPVLCINEETFGQSNSILRYVSRKVRTYPSNPKNALHIDQWCDFHVDFMTPLRLNMYPDRFGTTVEKSHRQWCLDVHIPKFLSYLDDNLKDGDWIGGMDSLSMADMCWYPTILWLVDKFDGFEQSSLDKYENIVRFVEDMKIQLKEEDEEDEEDEKDEEDEEDEEDEDPRSLSNEFDTLIADKKTD